MNVETLINNDEYKIIFLKAILLGINYGKSNNSDYYMNNIKGEIDKIYNKLNNPEIIKYNIIIKRNETFIYNLENQKNLILSNIQKLSHSNYSFNHSKINLLKINLHNIQIEIEKLKLNIKKIKELKENNNLNNINNMNNMNNNNLVGELEKTLDNLSNLFS